MPYPCTSLHLYLPFTPIRQNTELSWCSQSASSLLAPPLGILHSSLLWIPLLELSATLWKAVSCCTLHLHCLVWVFVSMMVLFSSVIPTSVRTTVYGCSCPTQWQRAKLPMSEQLNCCSSDPSNNYTEITRSIHTSICVLNIPTHKWLLDQKKHLTKLLHADVSENGHLQDCGVILAHIPGRFPDAYFSWWACEPAPLKSVQAC